MSVNDRHIRNRFADVMQQTGKTHREMPPQFLLLAFAGRGLSGKQTALRGLCGPMRHFQTMPKQSAGTAMMMRLRGGQQMAERRVTGNDRCRDGLVEVVRQGQGVFNGVDQIDLSGQDAFHWRSRKPLHEGRVARNLLVGCRRLLG